MTSEVGKFPPLSEARPYALEGRMIMAEPMTMRAVRVDSKGRILLPVKTRRRLKLDEGTTMFMVERGSELRFRRAPNPFDVLAEQAEAEWRAGQTKNLRQYAAEHGIDLDAE